MIRTSNLSYSYAGQAAIRLPAIDIGQSEHTLLLGDSGSGKTTLLHLLGGLLRGYSGNIWIDKTDIGSLSEQELDRFRGKRIGFIFQKNHLIKALSVEKNLYLSSFLTSEKSNPGWVKEILHLLDLTEKAKSKTIELSEGQLQRVAIARAAINRPTLIFADEPTSALDDKNCERVISLLLKVSVQSKSTLVIATHDQRLKGIIPRRIQLVTPSVLAD